MKLLCPIPSIFHQIKGLKKRSDPTGNKFQSKSQASINHNENIKKFTIQSHKILTLVYNIKMINLAYLAFFYILLGEIVLFLLITLPTPPGFKSKLVRAFMGSNLKSSLMWVHLALCILAGLFFLDLAQTELNYGAEKDRLRELGNGHVGTEVRMGFLSYQIQRVERNKYITAMLIYASVALNLYVRMLYFIYKKRGDYDGLPEPKEQKQAAVASESPKRTSTGSQESSKISAK